MYAWVVPVSRLIASDPARPTASPTPKAPAMVSIVGVEVAFRTTLPALVVVTLVVEPST